MVTKPEYRHSLSAGRSAWLPGIPNELYANQYFLGQLGYIRELLKLPPLLGSNVELIGLYEVGKTYKLALGPKPPNLPMDGAAWNYREHHIRAGRTRRRHR